MNKAEAAEYAPPLGPRRILDVRYKR